MTMPGLDEPKMEQREVVDELVEGVLLRSADHVVSAQESAPAQFFEAVGDVAARPAPQPFDIWESIKKSIHDNFPKVK